MARTRIWCSISRASSNLRSVWFRSEIHPFSSCTKKWRGHDRTGQRFKMAGFGMWCPFEHKRSSRHAHVASSLRPSSGSVEMLTGENSAKRVPQISSSHVSHSTNIGVGFRSCNLSGNGDRSMSSRDYLAEVKGATEERWSRTASLRSACHNSSSTYSHRRAVDGSRRAARRAGR